METDHIWACFTWEDNYETGVVLDSEGNVDNAQTLTKCKNTLHYILSNNLIANGFTLLQKEEALVEFFDYALDKDRTMAYHDWIQANVNGKVVCELGAGSGIMVKSFV